MPVTTVHPHYTEYAPLWKKIRDVVAGEDTIKGFERAYLRQLSGQDHTDYLDYVDGARFFPATARTIQGFLGAAFRVPPVFPSELEPWTADITLTGTPAETLLKKDVEDKFQTGRYGLRVDMELDGGRPYLAEYDAERIRYWREDLLDGRRQLIKLTLEETEFTPGKDEFEVEKKNVYHVLDIDADGYCQFRIFRKLGNTEEWIPELMPPPTRMGERLRFIPFVFTPELDKPPLLDLANVNLGHYKLTADYYDAIKFTSKPQPWIAATGIKDKTFRIGSRWAWALPLGAVVGYLEYSGNGISDIRQALIDDQERMARIGAAVIEEPKEGVEAYQTARINQASKSSLLASIVSQTELEMTKALRIMAWWGGLTNDLEEKDIVCTMNKDFVESRMLGQDLTAFVAAWQAHGISQQTLLYNIKRGDLLPPDKTVEDEIELILNEEPPLPQGQPDNLDQQQPPPNNMQEAA